MNNRRIVIVNQDSGYLMIDVANALVDRGYQVALITGRLVERNKPLDSSVELSKIISYNRESTLKRLSTWGIGLVQILILILTKYKVHRLLLVSNPPFTTFVPLISKNIFSLLIFDVYPEALVHYNIFKEDSWFIRYWKNVNRKIFKRALNIYTLNDAMKNLISEYASKDKIKVVPIWTDNDFIKPIPKSENSFVKEHGLEKKFIIQYSGNLGKTHSIESLIDVSAILSDDPFHFIIIGGGEKYKLIESEIKNRKLNNVTLLPWQEPERLPQTLTAADIGVVTLGTEASNLSIPSKTYNLMSAGVPVRSIANDRSALAHLVSAGQIGANFEKDDIKGMVRFIKGLYEDENERQLYVENSLSLSKNYSKDNAYKFDV